MSTSDQFVFETDDIMTTIQDLLWYDLQEHLDCKRLSIPEIREADYRPPKYGHPYRVKAKLQYYGWLKRYIVGDTKILADCRSAKTTEKFLEDQMRIGTARVIPARTLLVLKRVRSLLKSVLGDIPTEDELWQECQFSRNSTVGFNEDRVYLDRKIREDSPVTGTAAEIAWFCKQVKNDPILSGLASTFAYVEVDSLLQSNVPKSFKIDRAVRPNTLIGSFRSKGLEAFFSRALRKVGISLARQQHIHQRLARAGSRHLHNVTLDLSMASDSFTPALVNMVLPRRWYNLVKLGRTPYVKFEKQGQTYYSPSFMAMGIGYTFPLMTLVFQSILLVLQDLTGFRGRVSSFGDDLIFPRRMLPYVVKTLEDLGFKVNLDKSFWEEPFRESCGGDFYDQVEVRPARPEGVSELLEGSNAISAYVYKLFNSLIRRWEEVELPQTFYYLRSLLARYGIPCYSVPNHFPETSGFKDGNVVPHSTFNLGSWCINFSKQDLRKPNYQAYVIPCLIERSGLRPVGDQTIFYWERLQGKVDDGPFAHSSAVLQWRLKKVKQKNGGSYRKMVAYTTRKGSVFYQIGAIQSATSK